MFSFIHYLFSTFNLPAQHLKGHETTWLSGEQNTAEVLPVFLNYWFGNYLFSATALKKV